MACFRGVACHRESTSYSKQKPSLGRIKSTETVIYVVFNSASKVGEKLSTKDFATSKIAKGDFSLARADYISATEIQKFIVDPRVAGGSTVVGLAYARVKDIRDICQVFDDIKPKRSFRGSCVINRVEEGDHISHAALIFCEDEKFLNDQKKGKFRATVVADLAEEFSYVHPVPSSLTYKVVCEESGSEGGLTGGPTA